MSWATIRPQIKQVIDGVSGFQEVALAPKLKFSGYPAAYVVPSDNDADYETTSENIRTYGFLVRIFYETKQTGIENALTALEGLVDLVIDAFDQEDLKGQDRVVGQNLPSTYTFINVFASPSNWAEIEGAELIMAEIRVRVRVSIDVT